ncbi:MAG: hypothetical protein AAFS10_07755 [Myxococcota bacterium]
MNTLQGEVTQNGRIWAAISYGSHFVGLPLGIIPLILRDDAYAMHHARHAVAVYLGTLVIGLVVGAVASPLIFCTFGLSIFVLIPFLIVLALWPILHAVHGLVLSIHGQWGEPIGTFGLGDWLFGSLQPNK